MLQAAFRITFVAVVAISAACTVHGTDVPALTGPSEAALSLNMTVSPDTIDQDGKSQATVTVSAFDASGKAKSGQTFRLDMEVDGVRQDFGLLAVRNVTTGSDGRASVIYTAPVPTSAHNAGYSTTVSFIATPIGTNFDTAVPRYAELRLNPVGVVRAPGTNPTPSFGVSPTPVTATVSALFDASTSCATSSACSSTAGITGFDWNFGDGSTGGGETVAHAFASAGTYTVRLTVTNDRELSASTSQVVTVSLASPPTGGFVVTPSPYRVNAALNFNADQSAAAPGRSLVAYSWNFGDGSGASGRNTSHTYTVTGTYTVVLTVVDDTGQKATSTATVAVVP
jgi:PKD repeat protein